MPELKFTTATERGNVFVRYCHVYWWDCKVMTLHLVNSKCFPMLLYGLEACPLSKSEVNSINFTATRFFMKLFRSSNSNLINECMLYFGVEFPSVNLQKRTTKFVATYHICENKLCQLVSKFILNTTWMTMFVTWPI